MKYLLLLAVCAGLLAACASLPAPKGADDALVVGRFVLAFPDGFFDQYSRSVDSGVLLHFYLPGERKHVSVFTSNGYFRFRLHGSDELILTGCDLSLRDYGAGYRLVDRLDERFATRPHEVVYLGQITVTYTHPRPVDRVAIGYESYGVSKRHFITAASLRHYYWDFRKSVNRSWDREGIRGYLEEKDRRGLWLNYGVFQGS